MNKLTLFIKKNSSVKLRIFFRKTRWKFLYYYQSIVCFKFKKEYYCPVNRKKYRTFIKTKKLLLSPDLGARQRHRFIWHYLSENTNVLKINSKLLHISPEYCFYEKFRKQKNIEYFPVDKFEPGYDYLSLTKNFDLLGDDLPKHEYDFIICNHVLEHIIDDKTAINNIFSMLKTGGTAIVSVPILPNNQPTFEDFSIASPKERKKYFGQWDHVRYYGTDICRRFSDAGFDVKTIKSDDYFSGKELKTFGVSKESYLFELRKH
ncbi:MAG: class I SAM-dependent methyltransferase [Flavobacteriaceae bacterium]|jgi:SAM-dependent methyltransferase|nr:class I SAM-dependent methyltransferase [Flavobacteriaceae bacterium]